MKNPDDPERKIRQSISKKIWQKGEGYIKELLSTPNVTSSKQTVNPKSEAGWIKAQLLRRTDYSQSLSSFPPQSLWIRKALGREVTEPVSSNRRRSCLFFLGSFNILSSRPPPSWNPICLDIAGWMVRICQNQINNKYFKSPTRKGI